MRATKGAFLRLRHDLGLHNKMKLGIRDTQL